MNVVGVLSLNVLQTGHTIILKGRVHNLPNHIAPLNSTSKGLE